jgi:hypothetical protein
MEGGSIEAGLLTPFSLPLPLNRERYRMAKTFDYNQWAYSQSQKLAKQQAREAAQQRRDEQARWKESQRRYKAYLRNKKSRGW